MMEPAYFQTKRFLASGKAPGPDEINNELIKRMPVAFHKMVVNAFIKIWNLGVTPRSWKNSHITLMYKKGDPLLYQGNWRPITDKCHIQDLDISHN